MKNERMKNEESLPSQCASWFCHLAPSLLLQCASRFCLQVLSHPCQRSNQFCLLAPSLLLQCASRFSRLVLPLSVVLLLASCRGGNTAIPPGLRTDTLRYATNITCQRTESYSIWTLRDPWDTTHVLHRYILTSHPSLVSAPAGSPGGSTSVIHVPVRRAGVATAVHCGLIDELRCSQAIAGVCEKEYIDLPAVTQGLADGTIADFGNGMNPNIERIMDVAPDVLLLTPFEHSGGYGRVERLGIPIVECAEYMEVSPLARAEWIRFYGEIFGATALADSIFRAVERDYTALRNLVTTNSPAPSNAAAPPTLLTEIL